MPQSLTLLTAPIQDGEQRPFDVLPETIAPVVSLSIGQRTFCHELLECFELKRAIFNQFMRFQDRLDWF